MSISFLQQHLSYVSMFPFKGIFAYLNYQVPRTRKEIFETLVKGLQRLEYRGYDSAGKAHEPTHTWRSISDCFGELSSVENFAKIHT